MLPDVRLTALVRAGRPVDIQALAELRRRHGRQALAYARLCSGDEGGGERLAERAFALAEDRTRQGEDLSSPWRFHLLALVREAAGECADRGERDRLAPKYVAHLDRGASVAEHAVPGRSFLAQGFAALTGRQQGLVWYGVVERERQAELVRYTGEDPATVRAAVARALELYREMCLRVYVASRAGTDCHNFGRILDMADRRADRRVHASLNGHLLHCPGCVAALAGLKGLRDNPRLRVAEALLDWGAVAYLAAVASAPKPEADPITAATGEASAELLSFAGHRRDGVRRRVRLFTVGGLLLLSGLVALFSVPREAFTSLSPAPAATALPSSASPPVSTPSTSPSASRTPSPTPSRSAARTPTPSASPSFRPAPAGHHRAAPSTSPTMSARPTEKPYTLVVNAATDLCLDVRNGHFGDDDDVISAPCYPWASTQRWRFDKLGRLHNHARPDYCLNSRGSTRLGLGVWVCRDVRLVPHGRNLRFFTDSVGRIRPFIAPRAAIEPRSTRPDEALVFDVVDRGDKQTWIVR
ncbi:ricin-type beta-trefoil lectin domain protein [Streptomyces decoyicus]|uniref:ricin-type beta-trefoil lectin domain protein n=1 Tax=Streptomyces decoyicus TaxID=249567 RepID=UPI0036604995